jgi:hypothetical protein
VQYTKRDIERSHCCGKQVNLTFGNHPDVFHVGRLIQQEHDEPWFRTSPQYGRIDPVKSSHESDVTSAAENGKYLEEEGEGEEKDTNKNKNDEKRENESNLKEEIK